MARGRVDSLLLWGAEVSSSCDDVSDQCECRCRRAGRPTCPFRGWSLAGPGGRSAGWPVALVASGCNAGAPQPTAKRGRTAAVRGDEGLDFAWSQLCPLLVSSSVILSSAITETRTIQPTNTDSSLPSRGQLRFNQDDPPASGIIKPGPPINTRFHHRNLAMMPPLPATSSFAPIAPPLGVPIVRTVKEARLEQSGVRVLKLPPARLPRIPDIYAKQQRPDRLV